MRARARWGLFLTTASLVIWAGGLVILGAIVAPRLFFESGLDQSDAGGIMAPIFRSFDRWILVCMAGILLGEFLRLGAVWVRGVLRGAHFAVMALLLGSGALSSLFLSPGIDRLRIAGVHRDASPSGQRFDRLHRMSERVGGAQVLLCGVLLGLCWIPSGDESDEP